MDDEHWRGRQEIVRSEHDVHGYVASTCFKTGPPGRVGIESEWFVYDVAEPGRPVPLSRVQHLTETAAPLPGGSTVTFEPGGQLELSTACAANVTGAHQLLETDLRHIDKLLTDERLRLVGTGLDPIRPPLRQVSSPRYVAMETYFRRDGPAGLVMMTSTAAVQVCLDAGRDPSDVRRRWHLANALTPVLVAAFANSPLHHGRRTGFRSTRAHVWSCIDGGRTSRPVGADPVDAWARYALDARVLCVRRPDGPWDADPGMTLREWVRGDTRYDPPTYDDLGYHLTTLFPPVRPHGWLELRMIDALPGPHWPVAAAVATALVDDAAAADAARDAVDRLDGATAVAARDALTDPRLRRATVGCFTAALAALPRLGVDAALVDRVETYADRYVAAGRTPADDQLDGRTADEECRA